MKILHYVVLSIQLTLIKSYILKYDNIFENVYIVAEKSSPSFTKAQSTLRIVGCLKSYLHPLDKRCFCSILFTIR